MMIEFVKSSRTEIRGCGVERGRGGSKQAEVARRVMMIVFWKSRFGEQGWSGCFGCSAPRRIFNPNQSGPPRIEEKINKIV
jgi:hypothetical protein